MKLSAKNKKMLTTIFMWFGVAVLAAAAIRSFKTGGQIGDKAKVLFSEVKSFFNLQTVLILIVSGFAIFGQIYFNGNPFEVLAVSLGVLTTGAAVVTTFNTTYVPKSFFFAAATQLTGVKITVQGDGVIFDSDANGLNSAGTSRIFGQVTNGFLFTIANGFVRGKNVIWEFTNSATQTPTVYVSSDETPAEGTAMYLQLLRQAVLANSGQDFQDFATLSLPSLGATDIVNVLYNDGTQQQLNRVDLNAALGRFQNVVNTPIYSIDNFGMTVKKANVLAGAAQTAYVQRWVPAQGGGMISQVINNS